MTSFLSTNVQSNAWQSYLIDEHIDGLDGRGGASMVSVGCFYVLVNRKFRCLLRQRILF